MTKNNNYKISTGTRKVSPSNGTVLEEDYIVVEAFTKKECEEMYNKLKKEKK